MLINYTVDCIPIPRKAISSIVGNLYLVGLLLVASSVEPVDKGQSPLSRRSGRSAVAVALLPTDRGVLAGACTLLLLLMLLLINLRTMKNRLFSSGLFHFLAETQPI